MLITLNNHVPPLNGTDTATNMHFHGLAVSPLVPGDNVLMVRVESLTSFTYKIVLPQNHAPGLYWYHPHIYGLSEFALLGGIYLYKYYLHVLFSNFFLFFLSF